MNSLQLFFTGFIRISIQDRKGYVLVDPGMGLQFPMIFMEDELEPHSGKTRNLLLNQIIHVTPNLLLVLGWPSQGTD